MSKKMPPNEPFFEHFGGIVGAFLTRFYAFLPEIAHRLLIPVNKNLYRVKHPVDRFTREPHHRKTP